MSDIEIGKKVNVVWADHWCTDQHTSYSLEEIKEMSKPCVRETPGYYVGQNRRVLQIAGTKEEDGTFTEINYFMKRSVIRVEEL